ncbi:MAG: acyl-CoA desaturase [Acidobacteria bacterium]|nr:MAG: acyl-CoA desaturase [Acidobacteriota bacterium]
MFQGLLPLPWWGYVLVALAMTHMTVVAVTIFLHRAQAHRSVTLHPAVEHALRFWLWLTTGLRTKEWVAVHRKHHAKVETADDPHSPRVKGLWKVVFGGVGLYRAAAADPETLATYGKGTPDDAMERRVYAAHPMLGIVLMAAVDLALFGAAGALIWIVQMIWIPFWAAGVINGIGHRIGYRNFDTRDDSSNIVPWGVIMGGEELHNNHHARPGSARLSHRWFELDIAWIYLLALERLGLARLRRPRQARPAPAPDGAAAAAKRYAAEVLLPALREELSRAEGAVRAMLARCQEELQRNPLGPAPTAERLERAEEVGPAVRAMLAARRRLVDAWKRASRGAADGRAAIEEWLETAERSGVEMLERFAAGLRLDMELERT